jgi:hypothetical protein
MRPRGEGEDRIHEAGIGDAVPCVDANDAETLLQPSKKKKTSIATATDSSTTTGYI